MDEVRERCRELLASCRPAWTSGHGAEAWQHLAQAEELAEGYDDLQVETWAIRAGLHLLAEQLPESASAARQAISCADRLGAAAEGWEQPTALALADARVTLASMADGGPYSGSGQSLEEGLDMLDRVAHDPALAGSVVASRAVNNALVMRLDALTDDLAAGEAQVRAWMLVSEARTLTRTWPDQGNVLRQAVDLGITCGQWERAWSSAQEQISGAGDRNELVAVLAKAAVLAWHAGRRDEGRELGERARSLSVAVDHPWVRTYAYLGHVVAAACGAGDLGRALTSYTRCTTTAGHATRPHRAWYAAWVALESGHPPGEVERFLRAALPGRDPVDDDWCSLLLADSRGQDVAPAAAARLLGAGCDLPVRARVHLALAHTHRSQGLVTAASLELERARALLASWPGWMLRQVERESADLGQEVVATPAQRRVLDQLVEGRSNEEIARSLGLSARTVAVHVTAMLSTNGLSCRTALAARHLRASFQAAGSR